jgi:hypothetical protein
MLQAKVERLECHLPDRTEVIHSRLPTHAVRPVSPIDLSEPLVRLVFVLRG